MLCRARLSRSRASNLSAVESNKIEPADEIGTGHPDAIESSEPPGGAGSPFDRMVEISRVDVGLPPLTHLVLADLRTCNDVRP